MTHSQSQEIQGETVGSENNEYYILIYEITFEDRSVLYEKFEFSTTDEPDKIMFFQYNISLDEL